MVSLLLGFRLRLGRAFAHHGPARSGREDRRPLDDRLWNDRLLWLSAVLPYRCRPDKCRLGGVDMFAPKVAELRTRTVSGPDRQPSTSVARRPGCPGPMRAVLDLQRRIGNQATLKILAARQADEEGQQALNGDPASSNGPSGAINISEELFVANGQDETGGVQVQRAHDGDVAVARQRTDDIPPPSPYPSANEWFWDIHDDASSLYGMTCQDGAERGFFVMWNEQTRKSSAGPTAMGAPAVGCSRAEIHLGPVPRDAKPLFPVGWVHTHPMANPGCHKLGVGPSKTDKDTSGATGLPGMVIDTRTPASPCADSGSYFFGPALRQP
jgi:hypothetical protein